jgi:hypothetical protein
MMVSVAMLLAISVIVGSVVNVATLWEERIAAKEEVEDILIDPEK